MRKYLLVTLGLAATAACCSAAGKSGSTDLPEWMAGKVVTIPRSEREKHDAFLSKHRIVSDHLPAALQDSFQKQNFPDTMAECAIPESELPGVVEGHPRILVRARPWKGGLSLEQLRQRTKEQPWVAAFQRMGAEFKRKVADKTPFRSNEARGAALYHLVTGDESVVPGVVQSIMSRTNAGYGMGGLPFILYDWIYNSRSLTPEVRKELEEHLVKLAYNAVELQEGPNCHDIWRHRGGGAVDPLLAGLVLCGEHPEGEKLLRMGIGYYRRAFLPAYQHTGGGWLGGGHSYDGAVWNLPLAFACWASATDQDIFRIIKRDYGDWLQRHMYFWMHQVFPDRTRSESIGTNYDPWKLIINTDGFLITSRAYQNPDGHAFLRWLGEGYEPKSSQGLHILLYDPGLEKKGPSDVLTRPYSHLWGRDGLGYVQMRSRGWQPDSVAIEFKAVSADHLEASTEKEIRSSNSCLPPYSFVITSNGKKISRSLLTKSRS